MNKKFLIIGLVVVIMVTVYFFIQKKPVAIPVPFLAEPTTVFIQKPVFPSPITQRPPAYTVNIPSLPSFPSKITAYTAIVPQTITYSSLSSRLGFSGNPKIISISRGTFSSWSNNNSSLSIGGDPTEISYNLTSPLFPLTSTEKSLTETAQKYVQSLLLVPTNGQLNFESIYYFAPQGHAPNELKNASGATIARINFRLSLDNRPLFTKLPDLPTITVKITGQNTIIGLVGYWFSGFTKIGTVSIISINEALERLTGGAGIITYLYSDEDKNNEELPSYRVSISTISSVQLGYYYASSVAQLSPVFVFRGTGTDKTTEKTVKTTTIVSALP